MTDHRHMDLADYIDELTRPHTHTEHYDYAIRDVDGHPLRRPPGNLNHRTRVPALLTQLANNDVQSAAAEEGARPGFQSKPAARLDALAALADIDLEVNRWIVDIGDQPARLDTARALQQLHGMVVSADPVTRRAVLKDVRRWWTRARIVTGWDSPAWTPDATCPQCGERGTLRVRLADHIAMCTYRGDDHLRREACGALWDEATIGLLADHIRLESSTARQARPGVGPCWCPVPQPAVPDLRFQCQRCGSARCWHAVQARLVATVRAS